MERAWEGGVILALRLWWCVLLAGLAGGAEPPRSPARQTISLNGQWFFQTNGAPAAQWKSVPVPSYWESHEGTNFDGIGWYWRAVEPLALPPGRRALLHFQAAATEAEVWWNGQRLGAHLGGWTPFRFEVTPRAPAEGAGMNEIRVWLDEKVGHNTQGFLPVLQPHFGGLWQDVELLVVPGAYIDDLRVRAAGKWLLGRLLAHLANGPAPKHALSPGQWARLKRRLGAVEPASEGDILK